MDFIIHEFKINKEFAISFGDFGEIKKPSFLFVTRSTIDL